VTPQLTTKTFNPMAEGADHGLGAHRIDRQLRSSLERLGVDRVDLYLAHEFDPDVPLEETLGVFGQLRQKRRIGAYGVSNFDAGQLAAALKVGGLVAIQNSHSLLDRDDEGEVLPLCAARNVAYCAFSPLAGGWLTGKYRRGQPFPAGSRMTQRPEPYEPLVADGTYTALEALEQLAGQRGMSLAGIALAWLLADDRVTQIVIGPGKPEHLTPVKEALEHPLSLAERAALSKAFR
jgi:aryl-alcohol dehydrogenase-like predicted oxidoreductase